MTALRELIEAVEAGASISWGFGPSPSRRALPEHWKLAMDACHGSLDATRALHEAVLPGWGWNVTGCQAYHGNEAYYWAYVCDDGVAPIEAEADNHARAWLLAILKALEAQS